MSLCRFNVYLLILLFLTYTGNTFAFGIPPSDFFKSTNPEIYFSKSRLGYGHLTPKILGSEIRTISSSLIQCSPNHSINGGPLEQIEHEVLREQEDLSFFVNIIIGSEVTPKDQMQTDFLATLENTALFYNSEKLYQPKVFSRNFEEWHKINVEQIKMAEKFLYIQHFLRPEENLKAALMLAIIREKPELAFRNLESLIYRSFPLLDDPFLVTANKYLAKMFKKSEEGYKTFLMNRRNEDFYTLGDYGARVDTGYSRDLRKFNKSKGEEHFIQFMTEYSHHLNGLVEKINKGEKRDLILSQLFSEGKLQQPACALPQYQIECSGVERLNNVTRVNSWFYLEYFGAYRSYQITELNDKYLIDVPLQFFNSDNLNVNEIQDTIVKWQNWSETFYNQDLEINGKQVEFRFSFHLSQQANEQSINIHQCYNASRSSTNCDLPSQPNAKNLTLDLKEDVLLEEVGHHMGLIDEYQIYYYHFNMFGAADSFMVAPENFKLYPYHLELILAPVFQCN